MTNAILVVALFIVSVLAGGASSHAAAQTHAASAPDLADDAATSEPARLVADASSSATLDGESTVAPSGTAGTADQSSLDVVLTDAGRGTWVVAGMADGENETRPDPIATLSDLTGFSNPASSKTSTSSEAEGFGAARESRDVALGVGDLDGDGQQDVIHVETKPIGFFDALPVRAVALDGIDGSPLWSHDLGGVLWIGLTPVGDPTRDDADDVLVFRYEYEDESDDREWRLELWSGTTGEAVWSRSYPERTTDSVVAPIPTDDHNGDGVADIVVNAVDRLGVRPHSSTAQILDGATGLPFFEREWSHGFAWLEPAGDAVGSPAADLFWQGWAVTPRCALGECPASEGVFIHEMLDGQDPTAVAWRVARGPGELLTAVPAAGDLDGDARDDMVFRQVCENGLGCDAAAWGAVSGSDGAELWRRPLPDDVAPFLPAAGPIGGGAGDDMLLAHASVTTNEDPVRVERVDGATGATLFETSHALPIPGFASISFTLIADADGDAVRDLLVELSSSSGSALRVESAADGGVMVNRSHDSWAIAVPMGDLDRAGKKKDVGNDRGHARQPADDILWFREREGMDGWFEIEAISLPTGDPLWTRTDTLVPFGHQFTFSSTTDGDGGTGSDIVYVRNQDARIDVTTTLDEYRGEGRVDVLDGGTGTVLWGHGDPLTPVVPHDHFPKAKRIDLPSYADTVQTMQASHGWREPSWPCLFIESTVWYRYDAVEDGGLMVDTFGSDYDTMIGVFTGDDLDDLTPITCNDDVDGTLQSKVAVPVRAGTTYYVQVGGFDLRSWHVHVGTLQFHAEEVEVSRPANDDFADAIDVGSMPTARSTETFFATTEPGEPAPCGSIRSTIWYRVEAPEAGTVSVDTEGSGYDTALAAYRGPNVDALDTIGCDDDGGAGLTSRLAFDVEPGVTYYVQAGGYDGDAGPLELRFQFEAA